MKSFMVWLPIFWLNMMNTLQRISKKEHEVQKLVAMGLNENTERSY